MAEAGVYGARARRVGESRWAEVAVPVIEHEDRLSRDQADDVWTRIFALFNAGGESAQLEVKLAVYAYYAVNGASVKTNHSHDITTGGGVSVAAVDVRNVIGESRLRRFMRSDVDDAYCSLKESEVLERDEVFVSKAMNKGVPRGYAHCAVDYLRGCSLMTPEEEEFAKKHFESSLERARNSRGGLTLEEVEEKSRSRGLKAQREQRHAPLDEF